MPETLRERVTSRVGQLRQARKQWEREWTDIGEQLWPWRVARTKDRTNRPKRHNNIINNTPTRAVSRLSSALMSGVTSPSRDWFALGTADPDLAEVGAVKEWLWVCQRRIQWALSRSNFYTALASSIYPQLAGIGTAAMIEEEDAAGLWFYPMGIGEFYLDGDESGRIDTFVRETWLTTRQLVHKFGLNACSPQVRLAWDQGNYDNLFTVFHAIQPNEELDLRRSDWRGMRFASLWWEEGSTEIEWLKRGGYREFPVLAPRWQVLAGDSYGCSPGWEAGGDCKALQHQEKRLASLVDKTANPPMKISASLKASRASLLPGDITVVEGGANGMFEPAMIINPAAIPAMAQHIERHEQRIEAAFFVDLWMSLLRDSRSQRATATEVQEKKNEAMLQLGPLLEALNGDLLRPCVERTFAILGRQGLLPPAPEEIAGQELKIEFISIMHQALKLTSMNGVRTLVMETGALAQLGRTDALDKLNVDSIIDEYANMLGINPEMVHDNDEANAARQARADQEQAARQGEAMLAATQGASNLGGIDPTKLSEVARMISPAAAAQVEAA